MRAWIVLCAAGTLGMAHAASDSCESLVSKELARRGLGSFDFPKTDKIQINQGLDSINAKLNQVSQKRQRVAAEIKKGLIKTYTKKPNESLEAYSKRIVPFLAHAITRTQGQAVPDKVLTGPEAEKMIQKSFTPFQNNPEKYAEAMISNVFTTAPGNQEFFIDQNPVVIGLDQTLDRLEKQFHYEGGITYLDFAGVKFDSMVEFGTKGALEVRAFLQNGKVRGIETVTKNSPNPEETTIRTFIVSDPGCKVLNWKKTIFNSKGSQYDAYLFSPEICRSKDPQKISRQAEDASKTAQECGPYIADLAPKDAEGQAASSSSEGLSAGDGANRAE